MTESQRRAFRCWSGLWRGPNPPYSRLEACEILRDLLWDVPPRRRASVYQLTDDECRGLIWRMLVLGLVLGEPDREWKRDPKLVFKGWQ